MNWIKIPLSDRWGADVYALWHVALHGTDLIACTVPSRCMFFGPLPKDAWLCPECRALVTRQAVERQQQQEPPNNWWGDPDPEFPPVV